MGTGERGPVIQPSSVSAFAWPNRMGFEDHLARTASVTSVLSQPLSWVCPMFSYAYRARTRVSSLTAIMPSKSDNPRVRQAPQLRQAIWICLGSASAHGLELAHCGGRTVLLASASAAEFRTAFRSGSSGKVRSSATPRRSKEPASKKGKKRSTTPQSTRIHRNPAEQPAGVFFGAWNQKHACTLNASAVSPGGHAGIALSAGASGEALADLKPPCRQAPLLRPQAARRGFFLARSP